MAQNKMRGLGRGLESLFSENAPEERSVTRLRLTEIEPNRDQPRRNFDDDALSDLAESIKTHGLIQPIVVRPTSDFTYQIVAGERRWRASMMAGLETVPVIIRDMSDEECFQLALIENLQREDLGPVEEALGYRSLMEKYSMTQDEVAQSVGKSRPAVANSLRLLNLPQDILDLLEAGKITPGHARAMLAIDNKELLKLAVDLALSGASVRAIERLAGGKKKAAPTPVAKPNYYKEVELSLRNALGKKVRIVKGKKKSTLEIDFYDQDELTDLAQKLGK